MKIIELISENFKRLNAHVVMDGKSVTIEGKNGVGKSTFIDAIWVALTGKETPGKPIKDGQDSAKISVKVKSDDGSVFIVEKKFSTSGATLTVKTPEGAKFSSPQKFLDEKIGKISFDPFEFVHKQPREQKKFLMELLNLDFEGIDSEKKSLLHNKEKLSKEYINIKTELDKFLSEKDDNEVYEEKNIDDALKKFETLNSDISKIERLEIAFHRVRKDIEERADYLETLKVKRKLLDNEIREGSELLDKSMNDIKEFGKNPSFELPELSNIQEEINHINENNRRFEIQKENRKSVENLRKKLDEVTRDGRETSEAIKKIEMEKVEMMSSVKMPIDGLSFGEDGLLFDGLPFEEEQLSTAKLIETGIKISMALNPALRIMRIKDGSLLDSETFEIIKSAAKNNDYQLFIERVSDSSEIGFIIEEDDENAN